MRIVADPWLCIYRDPTSEAGLVVEHLLSKNRWVIANEIQLEMLGHATSPISFDDLVQWAAENLAVDLADARLALRELVEAGLLKASDDPTVSMHRTVASKWHRFGWSDALTYFASTRDGPFLDYSDPEAYQRDRELMATYAQDDPPPAATKDRPKATEYPLPRDFTALNGIPAEQSLVDHISPLPAQQTPLRIDQIAALLLFPFGQTGLVELDESQGELLLKTVPSGGARHPAEVYAALIDTELPSGVYHYRVGTHSLAFLQGLPPSARSAVHELSDAIQAPKCLLFICAKFERSMWRYRHDSRSYRVVLHDLGHALEVLKFATKALALHLYIGQGFDRREVATWLPLDSDEELVRFALVA